MKLSFESLRQRLCKWKTIVVSRIRIKRHENLFEFEARRDRLNYQERCLSLRGNLLGDVPEKGIADSAFAVSADDDQIRLEFCRYVFDDAAGHIRYRRGVNVSHNFDFWGECPFGNIF